MDIITIYTKRYKKELTHWLHNNLNEGTFEEGDMENEFFIRLPTQEMDAHKLADFMETLMIEKNPVLRQMPALRDSVRDQLSKYDRSIAKDLEIFINAEDAIHLEGYIHFRMWKYSHAVDLLLYAMVKRELARLV